MNISNVNFVKTIILFLSMFLFTANLSAAEPAKKSVSITQIVEHPALDAARKGVKDVLAEAGYEDGKNLLWDYQSAQGNPATAAQIAKKFAGDNPDVIVAIATPSAQAAASTARNTNIVFSAVTDPVAAKLVTAWDKPGKNITGVSDLTPIDKHLAMVKEIMPSAESIGVIYNPGETNSVSILQLVNQYAPEMGLKVIEAVSPKSSDVQTAARSLIGKVDAIYLPTDNTVISAMEGVIKVGEQADIPVFAGDTDSVNRGAVAAIGFDYYAVGRQTGNIVLKILQGSSPADIHVQGVEKTDLFVNPGAAERMGITLPDAVIAKAKKVIM